ncbi:hypothetical protein Lal_00028445, partial [Lupinus albus]
FKTFTSVMVTVSGVLRQNLLELLEESPSSVGELHVLVVDDSFADHMIISSLQHLVLLGIYNPNIDVFIVIFMPPKPSSTSSSTQSTMEETSNTAVLARLAAMEASMESRLENALARLVEKLNNTLPNNQFPQQLPLHGSQSRPPTTMHDQGYFPTQNSSLPSRTKSTYRIGSVFNEGDAISWYKWMFNTNQLTRWEGFTKALQVCFGPSTVHNPQAKLFKLCQTSTVTEYQTCFERLSNEVVGLTSEMLLNCFLSGLNSDIARESAIQQPFSMTHAIGLTKLVESKITATKSNDWH